MMINCNYIYIPINAHYNVIIFIMYCYRFMGYVNMLGVAYGSPTVATGYGMHVHCTGIKHCHYDDVSQTLYVTYNESSNS